MESTHQLKSPSETRLMPLMSIKICETWGFFSILHGYGYTSLKHEQGLVSRSQCFTSPYYRGYNLKQIFEGDVQNRQKGTFTNPWWISWFYYTLPIRHEDFNMFHGKMGDDQMIFPMVWTIDFFKLSSKKMPPIHTIKAAFCRIRLFRFVAGISIKKGVSAGFFITHDPAIAKSITVAAESARWVHPKYAHLRPLRPVIAVFKRTIPPLWSNETEALRRDHSLKHSHEGVSKPGIVYFLHGSIILSTCRMPKPPGRCSGLALTTVMISLALMVLVMRCKPARHHVSFIWHGRGAKVQKSQWCWDRSVSKLGRNQRVFPATWPVLPSATSSVEVFSDLSIFSGQLCNPIPHSY